MAARDRSLYQFLIKALSYKYTQLKSVGKVVAEYPFRGKNYPFDPLIFRWARKILPQNYVRDAGTNNDTYLKLVGEDLLHNRNPELAEYANSETLIEEPESIHQQFEQDLEASRMNEPMAVSASASSIGATHTAMPHFQAPTLPSMPTQPDIGATPTTPGVPISDAVVPETFIKAFEDKPLDHLDPGIKPNPTPPVIPAKAGIQLNTLTNRLKSLKIPVGAEKFIQKITTPKNIVSVFTGGLGGILGGAITRTPLGVLAGGGLGAALPSWIQRGGGEGLLKIGGGIANKGGGLLSGLSNGRSSIANSTGKKRVLWIFLGLFLFLGLIGMLIGSAPPGTGTPGGGLPGSQNSVTITKTGDIAVGNGLPINYTLTVKYTGTGLADIEVSDTIPDNTISSEGTPSGTLVKWNLIGVSSVQSKVVRLTVIPQVEDIWVVNNGASASITKVTGGGGGTSGAGGSCPTQAEIDANKKSPQSCRYFGLGVDLFDTNLPQPAIDKFTADYSGVFISHGGTIGEFNNRLTYLINSSKAAGINPVLLMGYWRTENNFAVSDRVRDMGCAIDAINFYEQVDCALGIKDYSNPVKNPIANCAKSKDANSTACNALKSVRRTLDQNNPIKYPIATFDDFAEAHGSRDPGLDGPGRVNNNCVNTYNKLVEVAISVNACKVSSNPTNGTSPAQSNGAATQCTGTPVSFSPDKRLLPLPNQNSCSRTGTGSCGRPGTCVVPAKIVLHTTISPLDASATFDYFAGGAANRGVGAHFIIGKDGHIIQAVEMLQDKVEVAYAVAGYQDHISIEMVHNNIYGSKNEVPQAQYQATLGLIKALMNQYNIPLGNLDSSFRSNMDSFNSQITAGVYGHYQLNPSNRTDPGQGLSRDVREDLATRP